MKINNKIYAIAIAAILGIGFVGCKKSYLETSPSDQLAGNDLFKTTSSAYTALNGIHAFMNESYSLSTAHADFGAKAMDLFSDVMGLDMVCANSGYDWMSYHYSYFATGYSIYWMGNLPWLFYYKIINNANNILDNIDAADGPEEERNDIKGQALAYRAWAYLNLVQFYQFTYRQNPSAPGVPIYTRGTQPGDTGNPRGTIQQNFDQMMSDCQNAVTLLDDAVMHPEKSHISAATAHGIYARVALEKGDWAVAKKQAEIAAQDYPLMAPIDYTTGFNNANNVEWMWGSSLTAEQYTAQSIICFFSHVDQDCPGYASVGATRSIAKALYDQIDSTDIRKQVFNSSNRVQEKFHVADPTGFVADNLFMRSSEMYLIQAEAAWYLNDFGASKTALEDLVTARNPSYSAPSATDSTLLKEIWLQRRIELWGEGFGYRDMKRQMLGLHRPTGAGNHSPGLASLINADKNDPRLLFKIPQSEIDANDAIGSDDQNPF